MYATRQDMDDYFGEAEVLIAADRAGDGDADPGVVTSALNAATEEIDSYIGVKYTLPLTTIQKPGILLHTCCDIAMFRMSVNGPSMTDDKRSRYDDVIKWLEKVSAGKVTLGPEEDSEVANDVVTVSTDNPVRLMTRSKMSGLL